MPHTHENLHELRGHNCGHDTCTIHRTGDSLIIVCEHCGHRAVYPLDGGEPFAPPKRKWADRLVGCAVYGAACAALVSVLISLAMIARYVRN